MRTRDGRTIRLSVAAAVIVLMAAGAIFGYHRAGPAEVLLSVGRFGTGRPQLIGSTSAFRLPLYYRVYTYQVGGDSVIVDVGTSAGRDYPLAADHLAVTARLVVRYQLEPDGLIRLHETAGPDFRHDELSVATRDQFRTALSNLTLKEIYAGDGVEFRRTMSLMLEPELERMGLHLTGLALLRLRPALGDYSSVYPAIKPVGRVVIVGVTGLDPDLSARLATDGGLANLRRILTSGSGARIVAREPMIQPLLWTSLATGVSADRHGVIAAVSGQGPGRRAAALWDMVGRWRWRAAFVGWPGTYPATAGATVLLMADGLDRLLSGGRSGLDADSWRRMFAPERLRETVEPLLVWPEEVGGPFVERSLGIQGVPDLDPEQIRLAYAEAETYRRTAVRLLADENPALLGVHFDLLGKLNRMAVAAGLPEEGGSAGPALGLLESGYGYLDSFLGELSRNLGPSDCLWLVSANGLNPERGRSGLVGPGMLVGFGRNVAAGIDLGAISHLDFAPTVLAGLACPVPWSGEGRVREEIFASTFLAGHPVSFIDTYGGSGDDRSAALAGGDDSLLPESPSEHIGLGRLYLKNGEYQRAEAEFRRAVELDPADVGSITTLGDVLGMLGKQDEAIGAYRRALRIDPNLADALDGLGKALLQSMRADEAIDAFKRAIDADPDKAVVYCNLGVAYEAKGMFASAYRQYRRALEIDPNLAEAHFCLGNYFFKRGELDEAEKSYKEALRINSNHVGLHLNLGFVYARQVRLDEAEAMFRKVIEMAPNQWEGYLNLGRVYMDRQNFAEAERVFRDGVKRFPNVPPMHNSLAEAYQLQGKLPEAINEYERAVSLDPSNKNYQANLQNMRTMIERKKGDRRFRP